MSSRLFSGYPLLPSAAVLLGLLALPHMTTAAIALQQTRVIFDGDKTSASLLVNNQNPTAPYLAQGWREDAQGKKIQGPLLLLPPIQRIEAGAASQIKIQSLPAASLLRQIAKRCFTSTCVKYRRVTISLIP